MSEHTSTIAYHETLARRWAAYNDPRGRARPAEVARVMGQLSAADLVRMLSERGVSIDVAADGGR